MLDAPDRAETPATSDGPPARSGHDPVLAAIRLAPLASPADRELYLALRAEEKSDPRTWSSAEELRASLSKLPLDDDE